MKEKNKSNEYVPEPGEKSLAQLIKEAGEEARMRKKKIMEYHFKKLRKAIYNN